MNKAAGFRLYERHRKKKRPAINPDDYPSFFNMEKDAMILQLKKVRLAFADIFVPRAFEEGGKLAYGCTLLMPKNDPQVRMLNNAIQDVASAKWAAKAPGIMTRIKGLGNSKLCFYDGNLKDYDGFAEAMALSAKNDARPLIVDRDKTPLIQSDGRPYAGCYVQANVEIWAQDNKFGQAVRCTLRGLQFHSDGDAFAAGAPASIDEFEDLSVDNDEGELA